MGLERSVESKCLDDRQFGELKLHYRNCITTRIKTDLSNEFLPEGNFVHSYTSASWNGLYANFKNSSVASGFVFLNKLDINLAVTV